MARASRGITLREVQTAERRRVKALLERDRADAAAEALRATAELEIQEGRFVNLDATVLGPTPEQMAKGEFRQFTPKLPDGTVRTVKAYRRILTPIVVRLHNSGRIDDRQFLACVWYADCHERAGVSGRYKTSNLSGMPGYGDGTAQHPAPRYTSELIARRQLREVRDGIEERLIKIFDLIVLHNLPLRRAAKMVMTDNSAIHRKFVEVCDHVVTRCEEIGVDLDGLGKRRG